MTWQIPYVLIAGTRKYALKYADKIYLESSFLRHISRCLLAGYSGRCIRPVLLDPLDLHHPQGPLPARGQGRGPPGCHDKVGYIFTSLIFLNKIFSALTTRRTKGDMWHTTSGWASHFSFRWASSPKTLFDHFKSPYIPQIRLLLWSFKIQFITQLKVLINREILLCLSSCALSHNSDYFSFRESFNIPV